MYKKRTNFLNSAPTGTEGALRLLSATSGKFSQEAAIWPANGVFCCQYLPLGAVSSRRAPSVLVDALFKKFGLFMNTPLMLQFKPASSLSLPRPNKYLICCTLVVWHLKFRPRDTKNSRLHLKCEGTSAETRFRLSAKLTSPFKSAGGVSSVDYWQPRCAHQR